MSPHSIEGACYTSGLQVPIISLSILQILILLHWNLSPSYNSYPLILTLHLESGWLPSDTCLILPLEKVLSELHVVMALLAMVASLSSCLEANSGAPLTYLWTVTSEAVAFLELFKDPCSNPSFKLY